MSSVRMCDKCKVVFSELDEGWQTYSSATVIYDEDGQAQTIRQQMDACPDCAMVPVKRRKSETEKRLDALERENARLDRMLEVESRRTREMKEAAAADAAKSE